MKGPLRVLVAGGGVAALEATLALRALAEDRVSVELIAPDADFVYRPLAVVAPFRLGEVRRYPLHRLIHSAGAELRTGRVTSVDPDRRVFSTDDGVERAYDALLVALGAQPREAVPNALTFRGPQDVSAFDKLLDAAVVGRVQRLIFALPAGVFWPLPLYELALLTGEFLTDRGTRGVEIVLVTPEEAPLALFGIEASAAVGELLELRGIVLHTRTTPVSFEERRLRVVPDSLIEADRVVTLAALEGPRLPGIPHDHSGFIPTDRHGRVPGLEGIYAAGDATQFPIKQGGIAAQQADAAAAAIAEQAGAPISAEPFRPVLRGLLLTGMVPRYLRREVHTGASSVDTQPLWWPPAKIVGRYLAPFLASELGLEGALEPPTGARSVRVDVELDFPSP